MKNTLTLLAARLRLDVIKSGSAGIHQAVDRFEQRIVAFGKLYQLLSDGAVAAVSAARYFEELCGALSRAILEPLSIRCEIAVKDGPMSPVQRHRLGLILTELVTNAAKHAFPDRSAGWIRVEVFHRGDGWYCVVADNGVGGGAPWQGSGDQIVQGLARSLGARTLMESGRQGTAVTVVVPHQAGG
jgi:two-component sensor histidine kinase